MPAGSKSPRMADGRIAHAQVSAWAKVNLDLRILAREADGYHQLETIFQRISLSDDVDVRLLPGEGIRLRCTPPVDVAESENLAWRAAAAYRTAAGWPGPAVLIDIEIAKTIPTGGGLGGGSADAGAVLRALDALNPQPLATRTLLTIAATLGADVPFLTTDAARVLAWGRGERMLTLPPLPVRAVHCAAFALGVNTAEAYRALAAARADGRITAVGSALLDGEALDTWAALAHARNDFEVPVFAVRPDIAAVHAAWSSVDRQGLVRLSGSGATVVALSDTAAEGFVTALAAVAGDGSVRHIHAHTLDAVPPVRILSPANGFR